MDARAALNAAREQGLGTVAASLGFFTSSAQSFHPRPYNPSASSSALPMAKAPAARNNALAQPMAPMDPTPQDPGAVFIRPPFHDFPDAHRHPGGLTYALMAANPEWFLDADDFQSSVVHNPGAISYPSQLEPPRGWCPAKKKDLKERGMETWPEGEEPRLRCTFCRRTYAGVNAKSMWRRHVFEKHKIAMANRRDTVDRSRSKQSQPPTQAPSQATTKSAQGKENVTARSARKDSATPAPVAAQQPPKSARLRSSRAQSKITAPPLSREGTFDSSQDGSDDERDEPTMPGAPVLVQNEFPAPAQLAPSFSVSTTSGRSASPPLTSDAELLAGMFHYDAPSAAASDDDDDEEYERALIRQMIPSSPYDPHATPSFRHSPPRAAQPFRFASPSHPLHSKADVSLGQIALGTASPAQDGASGTAITYSPVNIHGPRQSNIFSTPGRPLFSDGGIGLGLSTGKNLYHSILNSQAAKQGPGRDYLFESPGFRFTPRKTIDPLSVDPSLDPFLRDTPVVPRSSSPPTGSSETESPVMRSGRLFDPVSSSGGARRPSGLSLGAAFDLKALNLKRSAPSDDDDAPAKDLNDDEDEEEGEGSPGEFGFSGRLHLASPVSRVRLTQSKGYAELALRGSPTTSVSREGSSASEGRGQPLRKRRRTLVE